MRAGDEPGKLVELLHEFLPDASAVGVLIYSGGVGITQDTASVEAAARTVGLGLRITVVSDATEFDAAFAGFAGKVDAVLVNDHRYFDLRRDQIIALAM